MRTALALLLVLVAVAAAEAAPRETKDLVNDLADARLRTAAYRELMKRKDPRSVYPIQGLLPGSLGRSPVVKSRDRSSHQGQ